MFALKQIVRLLTCFLICSTSEDLKEIKAKPGDNVVLQCLGTRDATIELLEWSRPDLNTGYVFYFRDSLVYEDFQHESYRGRVELKDPEMKDGDASVILKNVYINDAGTYECYVGYRTGSELINTINLTVKPGTNKDGGDKGGGDKDGGDKDGEDKDGGKYLLTSLAIFALLLLVAVVVSFVIVRSTISTEQISDVHSSNEAGETRILVQNI